MAIIKLDGGYNALPISYKRGNPIPLDTTAVWYDLAELQAYASSGVTAYVGQVLSLVSEVKNEEGAVTGYTSTAYIIADTNGTLEPIGTAPIGDEKTIVVAEDGTVSLKGVDALVFERDIIGEDGQPTGEKEEVQYQILMTKNGLTWVEPSKTTVEGLATLIDGLTQRVKALEDDHVGADDLAEAIKDFATDSEVEAAVKVVADKIGVTPEGETKTIYELIAAEVLRATEAEGDLSDRIGVAKTDDADATGVYAYVDGIVEALVNGVDPEKIDSLNELIAWVEAHPAIVEELDGRLDKVEGILDGFGGENEPAKVKTYVDDTFATKSEAQTATQVATAISTALEDYSTTEEVGTAIETALDDYYTAEEVDNKGYAVADDVERDYAKKATTLAGYGITDAYTATETDNAIRAKIQEMTGGESAADVLGLLNDYKASNDREVWGDDFVTNHTAEGKYEPVYSGESRVDKHANRILALEEKVGHDADTGVEASGLFAEIDAVSVRAEKGITDAAKADAKADANAEAITLANNAHNALANIVNGADNADSHAAKLAALAAKDLLLDEQIAALQGIDTTLQGTVADQGGKIAALESKDAELLGLINGKVAQGDFNALNAKVDTGDKNVSTYVADAITARAYDDTAVKALITAEENRAKAEEERLAGLIGAEASRADTEEKRIVGLVEAEAARADAAEKANKALIDGLDAAIKAVLDNEGGALDSIKELATWVEEHESEVLPVIEKNTTDIAALTTRVVANEKAIGETLPAAIATALESAKAYTDEKAVTADGTTIESTNNVFSVKAVSTDTLVQGELELVLNGGSASTGVQA